MVNFRLNWRLEVGREKERFFSLLSFFYKSQTANKYGGIDDNMIFCMQTYMLYNFMSLKHSLDFDYNEFVETTVNPNGIWPINRNYGSIFVNNRVDDYITN